MSSVRAASAAETAALRKESKFTALSLNYLFYPLAFETFGTINDDGLAFISELGRRIFATTDDPRETSFLFQRQSVAVQHFNAICFANSFGHALDDSVNQPKHT